MFLHESFWSPWNVMINSSLKIKWRKTSSCFLGWVTRPRSLYLWQKVGLESSTALCRAYIIIRTCRESVYTVHNRGIGLLWFWFTHRCVLSLCGLKVKSQLRLLVGIFVFNDDVSDSNGTGWCALMFIIWREYAGCPGLARLVKACLTSCGTWQSGLLHRVWVASLYDDMKDNFSCAARTAQST